MRIAAVGRALPPHYYDQETLLAALRQRWADRYFNPDRLERLHKNVLVGGRHLALPIDEYASLTTWGKANDAWIRVAQEVGARAVLDGLAKAGLSPADVDALIFVTVTGVATPSIDARLMNILGLKSRVKRMPIFGLGCVAGAAGIARAADYVRAFPDQVAVLLSVELCSLTLQPEDLSIPNLIASGLFGDGAAAAIVTGDDRPAGPSNGPRIVDSRSVFYPDTERVMGWDISETGFKIVLSADVPLVARDRLRPDVDAFLAEHALKVSDIGSWVCHPGGPKVLEAMQEALDLPPGALDVTWRSLQEVGNLSSTSVLMVLAETLENHRPPPGSYGVLLAMGPGFCSELVLLQVVSDTRVLYTLLVALVALGRLLELRIAARNRRRLLARGGVEVAPGHYPWMVALHTALLLSCPLEVWFLNRSFVPLLAGVMLVLLIAAAALRWWVISTLDGRWTTRIVVLPGVPPVTGGPYRFLRHPNYLAVILEIFSLPMIHTAWLTAIVFSLADALLLRVRIRAEEAGLSEVSGYEAAFADRSRLIPGGGG